MASLMMEYSRMGIISQTIIFQLCVIYTAVTPLIAVLQFQILPKIVNILSSTPTNRILQNKNKKGKKEKPNQSYIIPF